MKRPYGGSRGWAVGMRRVRQYYAGDSEGSLGIARRVVFRYGLVLARR